MSNYRKLVVFETEAKLLARAGNYPCLVNYNPFTRIGVYDDGVGHTSDVTFAVASDGEAVSKLFEGNWDIVELTDFKAIRDMLQKG